MNKKIGQLIKERVEHLNINKKDFANLIGTERSNVYNIFNRESLDTELLKKIGQTLNYDFFQHFLEEKTIDEIILKRASKTAKVFIEIEISETEIKKIGVTEKTLKILNKQ